MKLLRMFIEEALYARYAGYFNSRNRLGSIGTIDFHSLKNERHYLSVLEALEADWFTPSELFKPWFGYAVADYMLRTERTAPAVIYEVGAGSGALATSIIERLSFLRHPVEYKTVEISKLFAELQRQKGLQVVEGSFLELSTVEARPCFVIATEVWDNLPHDRIRLDDRAQSMVTDDMREEFLPLQDPLLMEVLGVIDHLDPKLLRPKFYSNHITTTAYIPTDLYRFIRVFSRCFPNGRLIVSDFSKLPSVLEGRNAPIVQTRFENKTIRCSNVTISKGDCDIFFPTDFQLAAKLVSHFCKTRASVVSHRSFFAQNEHSTNVKTQSGFNPMLEDFQNCFFLLSHT